jgi:predicted lipoprotein with Yx(FWY)xxD motif
MRVNIGITAISVVALMLGAGAALAGEMPSMIKAGDSKLGPVLTDANGMTLYYFDKDVAGKSNCNGKCAQNWPPLMAGDSAKAMDDFTIVVRDDGSKQWAHKGLPLYLWVKDQNPGDTTGHRVGDRWTVAQP